MSDSSDALAPDRAAAEAAGASRSAAGEPAGSLLAVMRSLTVIVPAYNEAKRLPHMLRELRSFAEGWGAAIEIIVVDDGSEDDTAALVTNIHAADPRFRLLRFPVNRGKGAAVRAGVAEARGEYILFSDADGSTSIQELKRLWSALEQGADIVIGSRAIASGEVTVEAKLSRNVLGRLFQQFVRRVAVPGISDTQCGFKLFRAPVARDLFASTYNERFSFDIELLMLARHRQYRVAEVAVNWRHVGGSKVRVLRDGLRMGADVIRMRLDFTRGAYGGAAASTDPRPNASGHDVRSESRAVGDGRALTRWSVAMAVALAVFIGANHPLVLGRAVGIWDVDSQFFPYFSIVADYARALRFMQWDPWTTGGLPTFAEPQVGALSPINNLAGLLAGGTSKGFVAYWLAIWFLGGAGVLLLGRHLRAPAWGACAIALGYLFCGVYTGNAQHTSWVVGFSFLPLVIWRLDVALLERRLLPAVQAGALWGLTALSAHPSIIILTGCFAALWVVGRLISDDATSSGEGAAVHESNRARSRATPLFGLVTLAVLAIVGIVVLSPVYHSFLIEGAGVTGRVGALPRAEALGNEFDPHALVTVASAYPHRLATFSPRVIFPRTDVSMATIYSGVIIPVFALIALLSGMRNRWRWWLAGLAVLSLACAMGESLPFRGWLYDAFYPMRVFRHSSVFRLFFLFSIAVLALLGARDVADALQRDTARYWRRFALIVTISSALAVAVLGVFLYSVRWVSFSPVAYLMPGTWVVLALIALLAVRLPAERRRTVVPLLLVTLAVGDAMLTAALSRPSMIRQGAAVERWRGLDRARESGFDLTGRGLHRDESPCSPAPETRCRSNDQLITKRPTFNANPTQRHEAHQAMLALPVVKQTAIGSQRIWFASESGHVPPVRAPFQAFVRRAEMLGRPPLLVHSREQLIQTRFDAASATDSSDLAHILALPPMELAPVQLLEYRPEALVFDVDLPQAGWLLVTDRWAPSWQATVNGEPAEIRGGNFIFRAVEVPGGKSRVAFSYRASRAAPLIALSWGTLGAVLFLSMWGGSRRDA